jgi:hypothetical protein
MYSTGYTTTDASTKKYFGETENKTWALGIGSGFGVTTNGVIYASGAILSGTLTADNGSSIGNLTIQEDGNLKLDTKVNNNASF